MMIDAKNFLNKDDAAFGFAGGIGAVGAELETIRSRQSKVLTQCGPPLMFWSRVIAGRQPIGGLGPAQPGRYPSP
jgi:hypothetical protein